MRRLYEASEREEQHPLRQLSSCSVLQIAIVDRSPPRKNRSGALCPRHRSPAAGNFPFAERASHFEAQGSLMMMTHHPQQGKQQATTRNRRTRPTFVIQLGARAPLHPSIRRATRTGPARLHPRPGLSPHNGKPPPENNYLAPQYQY